MITIHQPSFTQKSSAFFSLYFKCKALIRVLQHELIFMQNEEEKADKRAHRNEYERLFCIGAWISCVRNVSIIKNMCWNERLFHPNDVRRPITDVMSATECQNYFVIASELHIKHIPLIFKWIENSWTHCGKYVKLLSFVDENCNRKI